MSKEVCKKNMLPLLIFIYALHFMLCIFICTIIIARYKFTEHRTSISTCALERLMLRCGEAGTGLSMAEENVLYSATLDMSNGVTIIVTHSWWPKYKKR